MNKTSTSINMAKIPGNSVEFLEKICMQKLEEYFPAGIPVDAGTKIQYELSKIKEQHTEDIYRVYYEFQNIAEKENK